jgi:hypothetical protein
VFVAGVLPAFRSPKRLRRPTSHYFASSSASARPKSVSSLARDCTDWKELYVPLRQSSPPNASTCTKSPNVNRRHKYAVNMSISNDALRKVSPTARARNFSTSCLTGRRSSSRSSRNLCSRASRSKSSRRKSQARTARAESYSLPPTSWAVCRERHTSTKESGKCMFVPNLPQKPRAAGKWSSAGERPPNVSHCP